MAQQTINVGAAPNDGTGTPLRTAFQYTNSNFTELYTALGGGSGLPGASGQLIFNNGTSLAGDNELFYNATTNTLTTEKLIVPGNTQVAGSASNLYVGSILNPTLFANTNTKLVGIGTATPADSLHIFGAGNALIEGTAGIYAKAITKVGAKSWQFGYRSGTAQYEIQEDGVERYTIGNGGTPHTWYIGASTAMILNSTGLGIGTTVLGGNKLAIGSTSDTSATTNAINIVTNRATITTTCNGAVDAAGTTINYSWANGGQGPLIFRNAAVSNVMTLDSSGNVGIGVTPSAITAGRGLEVGAVGNGLWCNNSTFNQLIQNAYFSSASATGWKYAAAASTQAVRVQLGSGEFNVFNAPAGTAGTDLTWTQRLTLDASGNLLVGTTAAAGGRLDVQTATGDCTARVKSNAAGSNATFVIDYVNSYGTHIIKKSGTDVWLAGVIADTGATPNYKIQNASAVGVQLVSGATAWTTLSDETMKDIIEPISNAVAKVGSLRSVIGKFKTDDSSKRRSFLIAQDVQSVLPEAVDVIGENNELGLRYTEVIPLLVAAIKELTAEVNALKNA